MFMKNLMFMTIIPFFIISLMLTPPIAYGGQTSFTLDSALVTALKKNPSLKALQQRINAQIQRKHATSLDKWAKLSTGYRYTWYKDEAFLRFKDFPGISNIPFGKDREILWYFQVSQPIFTGFALSTRESMEALGIDIKRLEYETGLLSLEFEVKKAYFEILVSQGRLRVAQEEVDTLNAHLEDAKAMFDEGLIARNDLLRSEVALKSALQRLERARSELETKKAYLNILLNRPVDSNLEIEDNQNLPEISLSVDRLIESAIEHRPEIKALSLSLKQARLNVQLQKSKYYPKINLIGRYEQSGDDLLANRNDFRNSHNTLLLLEANWSLFEWGKTGHEIGEAKHKVLELEERLNQLKNQVSLEVKEAIEEIEVFKKNISTAQKALQLAKEDLRLTVLQYREQLVSSSEVLDARSFLTEAEQNLLSAIYGYRIAISKLERAVGTRLYYQSQGSQGKRRG